MIAPNDQLAGSDQDYARFVDLQQQHSSVFNQIEQLEVNMNKASQEAMKLDTTDYVVLHETLNLLDGQIKALFARHPEWRPGDSKSVKSPFGSVEQRTAKELDAPNPAMTVSLIEARGATDPEFKAADYLHIDKKPNLEALERLNDDELAKLGVSRVSTEKVTVKPAKVKIDKKAGKTAEPKGQP